MSYKATLTIGRFEHTFDIPDLLPEIALVAPTEVKMEYRTEGRIKELETLDVPKQWRFRLKSHNDKERTAWYDFYEQR
jgi:hypothetical protein